MKFIAPNKELSPDKCNPNIAKSTARTTMTLYTR